MPNLRGQFFIRIEINSSLPFFKRPKLGAKTLECAKQSFTQVLSHATTVFSNILDLSMCS